MSIGLLRALALTGGDWVIWVLLACSVVSIAVIIERGALLRREMLLLDALRARLLGRLGSAELQSLAEETRGAHGLAARVLAAGLESADDGAEVAQERMASAELVERGRVERRLLVLGTLGSNAPFVGLFGTVLGVIKAFHDLGASQAGPEAVMSGLSEALVATAVGLLVAIPCVVAYNYYLKKIKDLMAGSESLGRLLLARLKAEA
jgi:biopolymer transport protein ExbB/TolQ